MNILFITDIFGLCHSTDLITKHFIQLGHNISIVDPYQQQYLGFGNEEDAYHHFMTHCGHDQFLEMALKELAKQQFGLVVGFSAGASVAWRLSALPEPHHSQVVCLYPSQIRHHLKLKPQTETTIIFAKQEASFDVAIVAQQLSQSTKTTCQIAPYHHGFMNQSSKAYDEQGYLQTIQQLTTLCT
ncbi:dienelactone hydrolase family protein [Psychrobium sp. 1_MG-2023]|uniref:dienelactone hydrolase family protein n=1 Tax=Psychrobium sp. 1_MG-2023 TaxID=3062624 RepID=UPI000C31BABB|nr:dienelactone hydrolase family protein [Psychrobium sp. 1_MG-2023]MDP2560633.1 dienelactone hydrolase family protein [Psychrobium sp. 1_MG-2023]PKF57618.1 hypothetical protein CW748_06955 [Alteromonadales bacterium alter-6D02]